MSRWTAPGLAAIAVAWLLLITVAPVVWVPLAAVVYAVGSLICHQLADRSFHLHGTQLPVCARCFGLYFGAAIGAVGAITAFGRDTRVTHPSAWIATAVAAAPTAVTLTLMFALGLWLEGRIFPLTFDLSQPLVGLAAIADLGIGAPYFLAKFLGHGGGRVVAITYEYGNAFVIVAGLLNMLVVLDAWDVAEGRK